MPSNVNFTFVLPYNNSSSGTPSLENKQHSQSSVVSSDFHSFLRRQLLSSTAAPNKRFPIFKNLFHRRLGQTSDLHLLYFNSSIKLPYQARDSAHCTFSHYLYQVGHFELPSDLRRFACTCIRQKQPAITLIVATDYSNCHASPTILYPKAEVDAPGDTSCSRASIYYC